MSLDIITDIHGHRDKLESLLSVLGYHSQGGVWSHPERKVLFLGDYVDRGPDVRGTLHLVRGMVDAGNAIALMGNHEFNLVAYHSLNHEGKPLRAHSETHARQIRATMDSFAGHESELQDFLSWIKGLPMTFEGEDIRAVHACWSETSIQALQGMSFHDHECLIASCTPGSHVHRDVELLLKGPEIELPPAVTHTTSDGAVRTEMRVQWWGRDDRAKTISELAVPPGSIVSDQIVPLELLSDVPNLPLGGKPVFFGHYWLRPDSAKAPLAPGICCLDFSVADGGPLVAYRWDGNPSLSAANFVCV